ncbi:MAG: glycosyltransferase family 4 protein [Candidatus Woesebacteria bacterium]|nr:glycosyltransferase family 4 protein [Candidatus Woesebacteria bacterium]
MKILHITRLFYPHIGGVEKHVREVSKKLKIKNQNVTILTEKYNKSLRDEEIIDGIKVVRFPYSHTKFIGLLSIWIWLFRHRDLLTRSDFVHVHDVFIWYLPFRFLYPTKPVFTTIHGLEWDNPLSTIGILQKRLAAKLSTGVIGVGNFLEKYLHIKFTLITHGGLSINRLIDSKNGNSIVYVGRLEENTGLLQFLKSLGKKYKVDFCGDGPLREECEKYGTVHGFCDPTPYLKKAEYCVPGGYLAALEALSYGCKLKLYWNNKIKEDYWKMSPFVRKDVKEWARSQTWDKLADEYLDLYNHAK